jgi:hypothetical protein
MDDESAELIPFHALNEFMRPDYRLHVVRTVLSALPGMPDELRGPVDRSVKKHVRVSGFRSSDKAPARMKAAPTAEAFEKHPELVGAVLEAWAEANDTLRQHIFTLMQGRGWHVLPVEARRSKMPGFFIRWPQSEEFEVLHEDFRQRYPDSKATDDDISLMVVWLGMRLPYQTVDEPVEEVTRMGKFDFREAEAGAEEAQSE